MGYISIGLIVSLAITSQVNGHSWVSCTDYGATITGQDFDVTNCNGFIRGFDTYLFSPFEFGLDRGINYQPPGDATNSNQWCQRQLTGSIDASYGSAQGLSLPRAQYTVGETITLVWPAKNHANYECFANIPDTVMRLYVTNSPTDINNPDPSSLTDSWQLVIDWHAEATPPKTDRTGRDGVPFQNCPDFCDNTDRAVCFGMFNVPNLADGTYTFMWYWGFNSEGDLYTTCFEADISGSTGANPNPTSRPTPVPTTGSPTNMGDTPEPTPQTTVTTTTVVTTVVTPSPTLAESNNYLIQVPICIYDAIYDDQAEFLENLGKETFGNIGEETTVSFSADRNFSTEQFNITYTIITDVTVETDVRALTGAGFGLCPSILAAAPGSTCVVGPPDCQDITVFRQVSLNGTSSTINIRLFHHLVIAFFIILSIALV